MVSSKIQILGLLLLQLVLHRYTKIWEFVQYGIQTPRYYDMKIYKYPVQTNVYLGS